jgi:hypothetical protein
MKSSRRILLKALGICGASPLIARMGGSLIREAYGQTGRKRYVQFVMGGGFVESHYRPRSGGERDFVLPASLAPLEPFRNELLLVERLTCPFTPHFHGTSWGTLSMRATAKQAQVGQDAIGPYPRPSGISLDRYIAQKLSGGYPIKSINLMQVGTNPRNPLHVSADGPSAEFPAEWSPVRAFSAIFGQAAAGPSVTPEETSRRLANERTILDFVKDDVTRMNAVLAPAERAKLDQMLTSLRELERQLAPLADGSNGNSMECTGLAPKVPEDAPGSATPVVMDVLKAHTDVLINAIICGRTPVASYSLQGNGVSHRRWFALGEPMNYGDSGLHGLMHQLPKGGAIEAAVVRINQFFFGEMARLWAKLRAIDEAGGKMADNTIALFVNTGGNKHHDGREHAIVMLGNANRYLNTGRWVQLPAGSHTLADAYLSILHALGIPDGSFGEPSASKGPLAALKA